MRRLPTVTIIVLNWNGRSYLEACLNALSIQTHKPERIILVDNGSTDDSVALVQQRYPAVEILENEINLGYAGGNNLALRRLETEIAVLVNPDIVVRRDWLEELLCVLDEDSAIGIAGCKLLYPGEQQLQHAGGLISHPRAMPRHCGMYDRDEGQLDSLSDVDFVTGAAVAVRREMIETAGLLDEGFFMYFEDADWCARARRHGYRVVYVPQATAVHDESAIAVRGSPSYLRRFHTGRWRYLLKHFEAEEIVEETLPAEMAWLEEIEGDERRALGWAYRDTLSDFPEIVASRVAHGAAEIAQSDQAKIGTGLLEMRQAALLWVDKPAMWQELEEAGQVHPQPFPTMTPLLGPLFARLRTLWAGVAVKPYVGALNEQQDSFNQSFAKELQAIEERLREFEGVWMKQEGEQRELAWEIEALQRELIRTHHLLASIESRLQKQKEKQGTDS
jgi:GT2 family glycosyltransferase